MANQASDQDFNGCHRACRAKGKHSLIWGGCEHATPPEPTVSMSVVYDDTDGRKSIGFDMYTVPQLAELIEPALRTIKIRLGSNALALLERGEEVRLSAGEYASLALAASDAIVHRNDEQRPAVEEQQQPETEQLICVCGALAIQDGDRWAHHPGTGEACLYRPNARPRCPECQTPHDLAPGSMGMRACASILASIADRDAIEVPEPDPQPVSEEFVQQLATAKVREAATVDPAVCPRCGGDNREAFALCPACAEADGRLLCPHCREDITDYDEDDFVYRTGDDRPYCSGECVIAAHRTALREEHHG